MNIKLPPDVKRPGRLCVLVYGGRYFSDEDVLFEPLDTVLLHCAEHDLRLQIVQGGATGADAIARTWAEHQDGEVDLVTVKAEWKIHGKAAGPKRNQLMIDKYDPDFYLAVEGDRGTADMARRCAVAHIPGLICQ